MLFRNNKKAKNELVCLILAFLHEEAGRTDNAMGQNKNAYLRR